MNSRRSFLKDISASGALAFLPGSSANISAVDASPVGNNEEHLSLDGEWMFCLDAEDSGVRDRWYDLPAGDGWIEVLVPHTWQINPESAEYFGTAWYKKQFFAPLTWRGKAVRIEFEAVYHSATVWVNGRKAGEHLHKGYTAFMLDISDEIHFGGVNTITVMANNRFDDHMLPRNHSYDWAADGGITRPVGLHITARTYLERLKVTALPDREKNQAEISILATIRNKQQKQMPLRAAYVICEEQSGSIVFSSPPFNIVVAAGETRSVDLPACAIDNPNLWHFDQPHLYSCKVFLYDRQELIHSSQTTFGIKKIEVKNSAFYLNGERVTLMGVERMAGSNPMYGMAEPAHWIEHDHRDLKELNCVFTRVHWQQDKRVLDYCDRHGILIQLEVPTWGGDTFAGMKDQPSAVIMQNGIEQLTEQINREYNHPCVFSWGLCNEIDGQNPPAYRFAENMLKAAKQLDPHRLCSYASNSLQSTPSKDVAQLMDFIEWNEYYESWYGGTTETMERNLEEIHKAFPGKPIVISEYGWCRCAPGRKEGDSKLISILRGQDKIFRRHDYMAGLIFFCYNDYRTHIGDKGVGPLKQRVHGVVDIFGARKGSYDVLRNESSPVEQFTLEKEENEYKIALTSRNTIPAYTLKNYYIMAIGYGEQNIPLEEVVIRLPDIFPGDTFSKKIVFTTASMESVKAILMRPTGFSTDAVSINVNV